MNIFEIRDIVHTAMDFLPDIHVLQISHTLDQFVRSHPDYAVWQKCAAAGSIYSHGTVKMLAGRDGHTHDMSALSVAVKYNNVPVIEHLVAGREPFLQVADCADCSIKTIQLLVDAGFVSETGGLMLENAAKHGRLDIIKHFYDVEDEHEEKYIVVAAASAGHLDIIKHLVECGVILDYSENPVLAAACVGGHVAIVEYLISIDTDLDEVEPIYAACLNGHTDIVKMLLVAGADPHDVLDAAISCSDKIIAGLAIAHGAVMDLFVVRILCTGTNLEMLDLIEDNQLGEGMRTACRAGNAIAVKYFISRGAKTTGMIHYAFLSGCLEVVKLLVDSDATNSG